MIKRKLKLKWKIIFSILLLFLAIIICMRFIGTKGLMVREYLVKDNIPWVEGKEDYGIGEYLEFELNQNKNKEDVINKHLPYFYLF